ncbi:hypothetical protein L6164_025031 [Bauhinia variegata]|uniref:Uncharacterized protein n=1 Tax=Bauhinia variegata TaxID=167791 RepID=A0ACB9M0S8_BAUVA|nr:hypothetical protein L6164_025031 [Bauhinia variegata]
MGWGGDNHELKAARIAYNNAKSEGNHQEEARWANVIGDIYKKRGEYVKALKWLRIDYEISFKFLPHRHLLPTCQSLGELYLRLEEFQQALIYQKKHLELARDANDLVEQQRAITQLGRTYHELSSRSEHDHLSLRNAKKYFKLSMELAHTLRNKPPTNKSSFVKEYIDAHNNIGMLEIELDNFEEAEKILSRGLEICNEEELSEIDDGRSRLHHNLGNVYMELRMWNKAKENIENDIVICHRIGHLQGEAKGLINLGELHYRTQHYDTALACYHKAHALAKSLEDEDALITQIEANINIVEQAIQVMDELKKEEQKLKKLCRDMNTVKGTSRERKCLLQQYASLDILLDKSSTILAWDKNCKYAKEKIKIANELCDKERLSDSYLALGESYQKLRKFSKAMDWYRKSWEMYKSIGNLEGQALVKINIGNVLDSACDWKEALGAYKESYRIAVEAKLPSVQLTALENMHYSYMIRFDDENETRSLKQQIDKLKKSIEEEPETKRMSEDCCSETDTDADDCLSNIGSDAFCSSKPYSRSRTVTAGEELDEDMTLMSLLQSTKGSSRKKTGLIESPSNSTKQVNQTPKSLTKPINNLQTAVDRKRVRIILSDDDNDDDEMECSNRKVDNCLLQDLVNDDAIKSTNNVSSPASKIQSPRGATKIVKHPRSVSNDSVAEPDFPSSSRCDTNDSNKLLQHRIALPLMQNDEHQYIKFKVEKDMICIEATSCISGDQLNIESLKAEVACIYYLQLPAEKKSEGLFPIIQHIKYAGRDLESLETSEDLKENLRNSMVEASIDGWVQKRLIKMYIDCCKELSEVPNMKVLKRLYNTEVSDDEIIVSECDLQDLSVIPLLNALLSHKTFAMLDLSHNLLGNGTMEKLQKVLTASGQTYGGLTLDLHCNRFGPTALFQICECSVLFARLEVLNLSGNRLTDACGSYLSTILEKCTALCSLNLERCYITSRTIQKIADALDSRSVLTQLCIGYNNPISGNAIISLLDKLSTLERFSELNVSGLKLSKPVVDALCQLAGTLTLSGLMLGSTGIGTEGAIQLAESLCDGTQELVKLDLSYCGLTSNFVLNKRVTLFCFILELNLEGNPVTPEGSNTLSSLLTSPECCLKVLVLRKCQLGLAGVLQIIKALAENNYLEELNVAGNAVPNELSTLQHDFSVIECSQKLVEKLDTSDSPKVGLPMKVDDAQEGLCTSNSEWQQLEVADSEEDIPDRVEAAASGIDDSCGSSCQRNTQSPKCHFAQQLSTAICMAKHLQLLDLSDNDFSAQAAETFYNSWSSGLRVVSSLRHVTDQIIHFSTKEKKCCRVKPCCRKN